MIPQIDGILVQLPLPEHINAETVIERIRPDKDVDGFHPYNVGRLALRIPQMRPCTPRGMITLLDQHRRNLLRQGSSGRRRIQPCRSPHGAGTSAGRLHCHLLPPLYQDLDAHVRRAEILVVAAGKPGLVPGEWIRRDATVIDVGIHRTESGLIGDVGFDAASERAAWITPVPGGVGPMTVATLLQNTLFAAEHCITRKASLYAKRIRRQAGLMPGPHRNSSSTGRGAAILCPCR